MAHEAGKGSKRRPTDEEAYADNYQRIFEQKVEWEDEMVKEDDEKIKAGLTKKCMSCHKGNCKCKDTQSYWGY